MALIEEVEEFDPYRQSMRRLLAYVGLQGYGTPEAAMPTITAAEKARIAAHLPQLEGQSEGESTPVGTSGGALGENSRGTPDEAAEPTIYLSPEETLRWKAFLAGTPVEERQRASVRRRLSLNLWRAHTRGLCLWCWFPAQVCMCARLRAYRKALPSPILNGAFELTLLFHPEEVFRSTNTGHLAAYLLGAPLRVWGVPADDAAMARLQPLSEGTAAVWMGGEDQGHLHHTPNRLHHLLLYPEEGAPALDGFVKARLGSEAGRAACWTASSPSPSSSSDKFHLILLDGTWGQALSLNRHLPRALPRVSLIIGEAYEALFSALRKRTRASGVSTFEAVSMAVDQHLRALGRADVAPRVLHTLTSAMKEFVDTKCLLKFAQPQFAPEGSHLKETIQRRDLALREAARHRQALLEARVRTDPDARRLLLPPVLTYCYRCDRAVKWHLMPEHALGKKHQSMLLLNPTFAVSAAARSGFAPDVSPTPGEPYAEKDHPGKEEEKWELNGEIIKNGSCK
ncbi:unnamed protein product [Phytomonas sp. Hart1]|nr:unnamed protein product [Phytomonas sp. Hart1]|eukprot:CCW67306.1 unnamed protein product [Phytomonas sp. isolate Hart1]